VQSLSSFSVRQSEVANTWAPLLLMQATEYRGREVKDALTWFIYVSVKNEVY